MTDKEYDMQATGVKILEMRLRYAEAQFDWTVRACQLPLT